MATYRGITLMNTAYKIYAEILRRRLSKVLEERKLLEDTQIGLRSKRETIDAIFVLKTGIESEIQRHRGKAYVFFADKKGAFDSVDREEIWRMIEKLRIDKQLRIGIKELYEETWCTVVVEERCVRKFRVSKGVRQLELKNMVFTFIFSQAHISSKNFENIHVYL